MVRRVRKVQQELFVTTRGKVKKAHGGKRKGAGRPVADGRTRPSERHGRRVRFKPSQPVHVTVRCVDAIHGLRRRLAYLAIRAATFAVTHRGENRDFRIVHLSIQRNHLHLICEARDWEALARGMQGFQISAARRLNRVFEREGGRVFADRYHAGVLATPRQVRNALAYVLNNWRRHGEDRRRAWTMDPFSSAAGFAGWSERADNPFVPPLPAGYRGLITWFPKTWLLSVGWRRHRLISLTEVPGPIARMSAAG